MPTDNLHDTLRITEDFVDGSMVDIIGKLTSYNVGAMSVLAEWVKRDPMALFPMLTCLDMKHLYDNHIWDVFKLCDKDLDRFIYHVEMELPNQITGQLSVTGPYLSQVNRDEHYAKRKFGKPGTFWALEHPPSEKNYDYPIR